MTTAPDPLWPLLVATCTCGRPMHWLADSSGEWAFVCHVCDWPAGAEPTWAERIGRHDAQR